LTVNDAVSDYVVDIRKVLDGVELNDPITNNALRYSLDDSSESLGKKIKKATTLRIPALIIVGPKDAEAKEVTVHLRDSEEKVKLEILADFLKNLK
jgi:threonyl-tRNA synthetase